MRLFHRHTWGPWVYHRQNAPVNVYRRVCRCGGYEDRESRIVL